MHHRYAENISIHYLHSRMLFLVSCPVINGDLEIHFTGLTGCLPPITRENERWAGYGGAEPTFNPPCEKIGYVDSYDLSPMNGGMCFQATFHFLDNGKPMVRGKMLDWFIGICIAWSISCLPEDIQVPWEYFKNIEKKKTCVGDWRPTARFLFNLIFYKCISCGVWLIFKIDK